MLDLSEAIVLFRLQDRLTFTLCWSPLALSNKANSLSMKFSRVEVPLNTIAEHERKERSDNRNVRKTKKGRKEERPILKIIFKKMNFVIWSNPGFRMLSDRKPPIAHNSLFHRGVRLIHRAEQSFQNAFYNGWQNLARKQWQQVSCLAPRAMTGSVVPFLLLFTIYFHRSKHERVLSTFFPSSRWGWSYQGTIIFILKKAKSVTRSFAFLLFFETAT